MRCRRCGNELPPDSGVKCPYCGAAGRRGGAKSREQPEASGVFQTSAVLIAAEGAETVYRSMDEVPNPLRTKLLKSTNSINSATILIADRRGREEIVRVMRSQGRSSGRTARRMPRVPMRALLARKAAPRRTEWLTPRRRLLTLAVLLLLALAWIAWVFRHSWGIL
jgi:hypothetical protein